MQPDTAKTAFRPADDAGMRAALEAARRALAGGEPPIGACIVADGEVIACTHNGVAGGPDATAHAEILAIRAACRGQRTPRLDDATLYATVEPCPMCLAACHYAGIRRVVYGAGLPDMHELTEDELFAAPPPEISLTGGVLAEECRALLRDWAGRG